MKNFTAILAVSLSVVSALAAGTPLLAAGLVAGDLACLPLGEHAVVTARTDAPLAEEESLRVYFRRLSHEVEDFYWVEMTRDEATGGWWAVLPLPESARLARKELEGYTGADLTAAWWKTKETTEERDPNRDLDAETIREKASVGRNDRRDWLLDGDPAELDGWLATQKYEPAEWFLARVDAEGRALERTPMRVAPIDKDCRVELTDDQRDEANELDIGDTAAWQEGDVPFHWECEDISRRIDVDGDEGQQVCPAAIVWWPAAAGGLGALGYVVVTDDDPRRPEASPSRP